MTSIITPDCDHTSGKLDLMKKGCRARSQFLLFLYAEDDRERKPFGNAILFTCRDHATDMRNILLVTGKTLMASQKPEQVTIGGQVHTFDNGVKLGLRVIDCLLHPELMRKYVRDTQAARDAVQARLS